MSVELEARVAALEARVATLEEQVAARRGQVATSDDLETSVGLTWLNRLGAGLVLAGLALGALWANDRGYLSPAVRNLLLAAGAMAVLRFGVHMLRGPDRWRRHFAIGVTAVGSFGLYLTAFTASHVDRLITASQATILCLAITAGLTVASQLWRLPALASMAMAGALSMPLIGAGAASSWGGPALVAVLYVSAALVRRPILVVDHAAVTVAAAMGAVIARVELGSPWAVALVGGLAALGWLLARRVEGDREAMHILLVIALVSFGAAWVGGAPRLAALPGDASVRISMALVSYGLILIAVGVLGSNQSCRLIGLAALAGAAVKLAAVDVWRVSLGLRVATLFVIGVGLLAASFLYSWYAARGSRQQ